VVACRAEVPAITGKEWQVVTIGSTQAPVGAGGRFLTMNFDYETARVSGFAGCNQYSAPYVLTGDTLVFGPMVSTQMACIGGADSVEREFLQSIPAIATWQVQDSILTLVGGGVAVKLREGQH
jgi:heat shock protein HslJ